MTFADSTVFIVDDDQPSRESVAALVRNLGVQTALFESAESFLEAYDSDRPGCLVTDLRMLGMSGVELQQRLRERSADLPTIVLTAFADIPVTVLAMQLGATTVLEKPCRDTAMWDAVRDALAADRNRRAEIERKRRVQQRLESLTDQERRVLDMILDGIPNKNMARRLDVSVRTIEGRRSAIFQKLDVHSVAQLVHTVLKARSAHPDTRSPVAG